MEEERERERGETYDTEEGPPTLPRGVDSYGADEDRK
jgi:hypothetical protein